MLITKLAEHARTRAIPPPFYRDRAVRWAIILNTSGQCMTGGLADLADDTMPNGPQRYTPYVQRSGKDPAPMLIDDTAQYVTAMAKDPGAKAAEDAQRRNRDYIDLITAWHASALGDPVAAAVRAFFERGDHHRLRTGDAGPSDLVAIQVGGTWADETASARAFWAEVVRGRKASPNSSGTVCLACGTQPPMLLDTIPEPVKPGAIPVPSGRGRDAQLISVNTQAQGRGGKLQLTATPICEDCGSQAMAALNALLADSRSRRRGTDTVMTWWLRDPEPVPFMQLIDQPSLEQVTELHKSVHHPPAAAIMSVIDENRFYALTLGANQSRVVVRDWLDIPITELKANLSAWFGDHQITGPWHDQPQPVSLRQLTRATGRWDPARSQYTPDSAYHGAERDLLRCALRDVPPPASLLPYLLQRIRADGRLDLPRAALLRLTLTRPPYQETIMTHLDTGSTDPAYLWGRIFALLESIQRRALPDLNTTIRDRYFRIAMTQPITIYPALRSGANAHLSKLRRNEKSKAAGIALDRRLADLVSALPPGKLPSQLDSSGQARFAIGYDHQRAADMADARASRQPADNGNQETQQ
jgi:CRISPR-associated protein Csd1